MVALAGLMLNQGSTVRYGLDCVTTTGAMPKPGDIRLMRQAYGVTPRHYCSMAMGAAVISSATGGELRIEEDAGFVELVPGEEEMSFRVIATGFANDAMPVLRLDTGEQVEAVGAIRAWSPDSWREVASPYGQGDGYVELPGGTKVRRLDELFRNTPFVEAAEIIQQPDGSIVVLVVKGDAFDEVHEISLESAIKAKFGKATVHLRYVGRLPRSAGGKLVMALSNTPYRDVGVPFQRPSAMRFEYL